MNRCPGPFYVWIFVAALTCITALAQPPVGPDQRPKPIAPDELSRAIGGPTLVTLNFKDARPEQVVKALVQQAGIALDMYESTDLLKKLPPITVAVTGEPFIVALKTLSARLGLSYTLKTARELDDSPTGMTLQLRPTVDPQLAMSGPMAAHGPFVVIATSIRRARTVGLNAGPATDRPTPARDDLDVEFVILADPKLLRHGVLGNPTFFGTEAWTIRSAEDEAPWSTRAANQGRSPLEWRFTAHSKSAPALGQRAPALKAKAERLLVTTKSETWEVPNILSAKNVVKDVALAEGPRRYTVHEIAQVPNNDISRRGEMYSIRLSVSGVGLSKGRWSGWPEVNVRHVIDSFRLKDAEGRDFAPYFYELKDGVVSGQYWNGRPRGTGAVAVGKPVKALWSLPTEIRMVEIPVEFADLLVP